MTRSNWLWDTFLKTMPRDSEIALCNQKKGGVINEVAAGRAGLGQIFLGLQGDRGDRTLLYFESKDLFSEFSYSLYFQLSSPLQTFKS